MNTKVEFVFRYVGKLPNKQLKNLDNKSFLKTSLFAAAGLAIDEKTPHCNDIIIVDEADRKLFGAEAKEAKESWNVIKIRVPTGNQVWVELIAALEAKALIKNNRAVGVDAPDAKSRGSLFNIPFEMSESQLTSVIKPKIPSAVLTLRRDRNGDSRGSATLVCLKTELKNLADVPAQMRNGRLLEFRPFPARRGCFRCGDTQGHPQSECPVKPGVRVCYNCHLTGHLSAECKAHAIECSICKGPHVDMFCPQNIRDRPAGAAPAVRPPRWGSVARPQAAAVSAAGVVPGLSYAEAASPGMQLIMDRLTALEAATRAGPADTKRPATSQAAPVAVHDHSLELLAEMKAMRQEAQDRHKEVSQSAARDRAAMLALGRVVQSLAQHTGLDCNWLPPADWHEHKTPGILHLDDVAMSDARSPNSSARHQDSPPRSHGASAGSKRAQDSPPRSHGANPNSSPNAARLTIPTQETKILPRPVTSSPARAVGPEFPIPASAPKPAEQSHVPAPSAAQVAPPPSVSAPLFASAEVKSDGPQAAAVKSAASPSAAASDDVVMLPSLDDVKFHVDDSSSQAAAQPASVNRKLWSQPQSRGEVLVQAAASESEKLKKKHPKPQELSPQKAPLKKPRGAGAGDGSGDSKDQ